MLSFIDEALSNDSSNNLENLQSAFEYCMNKDKDKFIIEINQPQTTLPKMFTYIFISDVVQKLYKILNPINKNSQLDQDNYSAAISNNQIIIAIKNVYNQQDEICKHISQSDKFWIFLTHFLLNQPKGIHTTDIVTNAIPPIINVMCGQSGFLFKLKINDQDINMTSITIEAGMKSIIFNRIYSILCTFYPKIKNSNHPSYFASQNNMLDNHIDIQIQAHINQIIDVFCSTHGCNRPDKTLKPEAQWHQIREHTTQKYTAFDTTENMLKQCKLMHIALDHLSSLLTQIKAMQNQSNQLEEQKNTSSNNHQLEPAKIFAADFLKTTLNDLERQSNNDIKIFITLLIDNIGKNIDTYNQLCYHGAPQFRCENNSVTDIYETFHKCKSKYGISVSHGIFNIIIITGNQTNLENSLQDKGYKYSFTFTINNTIRF